MTYQEAIQYLYDLRQYGTKLGLDQPRRLAALAGRPQAGLGIIHVAGTNGKGSTCAMLESIFRQGDYRVGLFTSPHLISFRERIQINRRFISEREVSVSVARIRGWLAQFSGPSHPTFFEVITVMALCYFADRNCDLVILETGLGGRLDATNFVTPLVSVITHVALDHQAWLGDSLAQIAFEKAGIIKPGRPVVIAKAVSEVKAVLLAEARRRQSPLHMVSAADLTAPPLDRIRLPLAGDHQRWNAALAVKTARVIDRQYPVSDTALMRGLERVQWPGRFQLIRIGGRLIVLDGAHNPHAARALRRAFESQFPGVKPVIILGLLADKNWQTICHILVPLAGRIYTVPVHSRRTANPQFVAEWCREIKPKREVTACSDLSEALALASDDTMMLICGSLFLAGEAVEKLAPESVSGLDERHLNEL